MDSDAGRAPVVDWQAARRNIPGGVEGLRELATLMLDECPRLLAEISEGLADDDAARVRRSAHTLRGAAQHFGAEEVVAAAARVETLAATGDLAAAREAGPHLEGAVTRLTTALADA